MNMPAALSKAATLDRILALRAATSPEERERLEREILEGNFRFCSYHARCYRQSDIELDDLIAIAAAALLDAVRRFDPAKSKHFHTYARRCIRRDLATAVRQQGSPLRLPRMPRRSERQDGREAVAAPRVLRMVAVSEVEHSTLALVSEDPSDTLLTRIDAERISDLVKSLPDREATIIRLRYGLDGVAPHDLAEIGAILGISKQRVQQILDKAFASLRTALRVAA